MLRRKELWRPQLPTLSRYGRGTSGLRPILLLNTSFYSPQGPHEVTVQWRRWYYISSHPFVLWPARCRIVALNALAAVFRRFFIHFCHSSAVCQP